jgi:hypothetical protein
VFADPGLRPCGEKKVLKKFISKSQVGVFSRVLVFSPGAMKSFMEVKITFL